MKRLAIQLIACGVLLCAGADRLAAQPFFVGIGSLDGDNYVSLLQDISADGKVATGESYLNAFYPTEAIAWSLRDGIRSITPGRHADAGAGGVSGTGSVVTGGFIANGTRSVFRWTAETGMVRSAPHALAAPGEHG